MNLNETKIIALFPGKCSKCFDILNCLKSQNTVSTEFLVHYINFFVENKHAGCLQGHLRNIETYIQQQPISVDRMIKLVSVPTTVFIFKILLNNKIIIIGYSYYDNRIIRN